MRGEFVDVGGARLYYYAAGTRGAGEPLVLIHGCLTSSHLWSCIIPCLPAGHRMVIVDLLGHGRSDPPDGRPLTARAHADRLVLLLDALNIDRACLVGHGLGAAIARTVAAERVSRLALLNAPRDQKLPPEFRGLRFVPKALLVRSLRRRMARGYVDAERASRSLDHFMRPFSSPGGDVVVNAQLAALTADDEAIAPDIHVPTAIIAGANDPFVAVDDVRALHAAIQGATLEVLSDAHYSPEESPERVAHVITELLTR